MTILSMNIEIESLDDILSITTCETNVSTIENEEVTIDDNVLIELESEIYSEIDEYIQSNLLDYSMPLFHKKLSEIVTDNIIEAAMQSELCIDTNANRNEITEMVQHIIHTYFDSAQIYPVRSYPSNTLISDLIHPYSNAQIQYKIQELKAQFQPAQRTPEWYHMRHECITASNIYKALGSPAQVNQLIYEKCQPLNISTTTTSVPNTMSATHWGIKYEQVTSMIYEAMYPGNQIDSEFGCIRHPQYPLIGASPDGIVVSGSRIGHMLEIKNTVSREISDIPILYHWVQCQVQMETCGMDFCDYIQTHIEEVEYDTFYEDNVAEYKGIILYLISRKEGAANYKYIYMPFMDFPELTPLLVQSWIKIQMEKYGDEYLLFETLYWVLKEVSCVIIPRNRDWFQAALPQFVRVWETIEYERIHGYEHRMPKKRETRSSKPNQSLLVSLLDIGTQGSNKTS